MLYVNFSVLSVVHFKELPEGNKGALRPPHLFVLFEGNLTATVQGFCLIDVSFVSADLARSLFLCLFHDFCICFTTSCNLLF